jgi:hypothetical protein
MCRIQYGLQNDFLVFRLCVCHLVFAACFQLLFLQTVRLVADAFAALPPKLRFAESSLVVGARIGKGGLGAVFMAHFSSPSHRSATEERIPSERLGEALAAKVGMRSWGGSHRLKLSFAGVV